MLFSNHFGSSCLGCSVAIVFPFAVGVLRLIDVAMVVSAAESLEFLRLIDAPDHDGAVGDWMIDGRRATDADMGRLSLADQARVLLQALDRGLRGLHQVYDRLYVMVEPISANELQIAELEDQIRVLRQEVLDLNSRNAILQTQIAVVQARLDNFVAQLINQRLGAIDARPR